ncbi:hypothetical protein BRADI_1g26736v3 [Brachypodium distachyon]|uniref:Uncharacterized protein n=1 Tax=Brachypodium distachyon TaxID=15368 RepID=A0A0Q3RSQ7_BRADI|nr:hypothetical protein BRADI_1g26736v3 [Brachypodium distachyon]
MGRLRLLEAPPGSLGICYTYSRSDVFLHRERGWGIMQGDQDRGVGWRTWGIELLLASLCWGSYLRGRS